MSSEICRYFIRGTCRYGENCRFSHFTPTAFVDLTEDLTNSPSGINGVNIADGNIEEASTTAAINDTRVDSTSHVSVNIKDPSSWVMAPVFVPKQRQQQQRKYQQGIENNMMVEKPQEEPIEIIVIDDDDDDDMEIEEIYIEEYENEEDVPPAAHAPECNESEAAVASSIAPESNEPRAVAAPNVAPESNAPEPEAAAAAAGAAVVSTNERPSTSSGSASGPNAVPTFRLLGGATYAQVVQNNVFLRGRPGAIVLEHKSPELCPYIDFCFYGDYCVFTHGELCEMCGKYDLHPTDMEKRRLHESKCVLDHEKNMETACAVQRSKDKTCGICFDAILEKIGPERKFGILPNCNHVFCLPCIRKWRQAKQFENKITR